MLVKLLLTFDGSESKMLSKVTIYLRLFLLLSWMHCVFAVLSFNQCTITVSYTHLRAHETEADLVCRLLLEKKKEEADQMRVFEIPIKEKVMTISTNFIKNQNKNKLYIIHIFTVSF